MHLLNSLTIFSVPQIGFNNKLFPHERLLLTQLFDERRWRHISSRRSILCLDRTQEARAHATVTQLDLGRANRVDDRVANAVQQQEHEEVFVETHELQELRIVKDFNSDNMHSYNHDDLEQAVGDPA